MGASPRPPHAALLYHFTHLGNLPSILATGRLVADNLAGPVLATDVGDAGIKQARRQRLVPCPPGGVVADYVPFYFAPRSPMMYRIACDHRDAVAGRYPGGDDPLVYLVTSVDRVTAAGLPWVASDGNCAVSITRFTTTESDLAAYVEWPLMEEEIWKNTPDDPDRMRRRMAEFLVHREFPVEALAGFAVRTDNHERELRQLLTAAGVINAYVDVRPGWYYGYGQRGVK